tara:strand:- start:21 stop:581 length:561 start_codon:yes stop_codon:yes gene_type:complete
MNYPNPKASGSRARLTNGNPLATNGARAKRISGTTKQNNEGAFDFKLMPNPNHAPPTVSKRGKLIKALREEIAILDFSHSPLSHVPDERAASMYFRSNLKRRLVGAFVILKTFEEKWVSQKEICRKFKISKGFVCQVCKDAVEAGWFIKKVEPRHNMPQVPLYQCTESMMGAASKYMAFMSSQREL